MGKGGSGINYSCLFSLSKKCDNIYQEFFLLFGSWTPEMRPTLPLLNVPKYAS